jgi:ABC-type Zn uptake system ZnuABC Zn-binding protein ZnuA
VRNPLRVLALTVAVLLAGCSGSSNNDGSPAGSSRDPNVVATTTPVQDFVRVIGGDRVEVTGLLKPNVDAHDYEPSPADLEAIAKADLLVINGVGLEEWLEDTVNSAGFQGVTVDTSKGVRIIQGQGATDEHGDNPHIWHNPQNAKLMSANIERALAAADPADAGFFKANLDTYAAQLDALDADIARQINGLANKKLVTNHDAFAYYIQRYGLEFIGSVIPSFDTSAELSGREIRGLVAKIKATGVKAVFAEASLPPKAAEVIAAEAGVKVVAGEGALYGDGLGPANSAGGTYLGMMEHNTRTIVSNLTSS